MAAVHVIRYHKTGPLDGEELGEYEDINCIMPLGTDNSEGVAYVNLGDPVVLAIEEGFEVEVNDDYLDVKPIR